MTILNAAQRAYLRTEHRRALDATKRAADWEMRTDPAWIAATAANRLWDMMAGAYAGNAVKGNEDVCAWHLPILRVMLRYRDVCAAALRERVSL